MTTKVGINLPYIITHYCVTFNTSHFFLGVKFSSCQKRVMGLRADIPEHTTLAFELFRAENSQHPIDSRRAFPFP